jgi:hypothetical protein
MAESTLTKFREGKKIKSFESFYTSFEFTDNQLPLEEKKLWVSVFEEVFSQGDMAFNRGQLAIKYMEVIDQLGYGIKMETLTQPIPLKKKAKSKPEELEEELEEEFIGEKFWLIPNRSDGEEYVLFLDTRKIEVFQTLRTDDVFILQIDWVLYHYGSKFTVYVSKIESLKNLLVDMTRPISGDPEKRETKAALKVRMMENIDKIQASVDKMRWELFGVDEEELMNEDHINRQQALTQRIKDSKGKNKK